MGGLFRMRYTERVTWIARKTIQKRTTILSPFSSEIYRFFIPYYYAALDSDMSICASHSQGLRYPTTALNFRELCPVMPGFLGLSDGLAAG